MNGEEQPRRPLGAEIALSGALSAATVLFGLAAAWPSYLAVAIGVGGPVASGLLRGRRTLWAPAMSPVPALAALGVLAARAATGPVAALTGGLASLVFLVWLTGDRGASPRAVVRAAPTLLLSAMALGTAWVSALLLPSNTATVGVAGALLAFAVLLVAIVLGRPQLVDTEGPATA